MASFYTSCDLGGLADQAPSTARNYFVEAMCELERSGLKFTAADVVALAAVAAADFQATTLAVSMSDVSESLDRIAESLKGGK